MTHPLCPAEKPHRMTPCAGLSRTVSTAGGPAAWIVAWLDAWLVAARSAWLVAMFGLTSGCVMRVSPPAVLNDPVTVVITDYGYHSSVVLPQDDGQSVEFAFGQWDWFARGEETSGNALLLVLVPTTGALGTRVVPAETSVAGLTGLLPVLSLQEFQVERSAAAALREHLQAAYAAQQATELESEQGRMRFVQTAEPFSIFYTCNHVTADWLVRLGCRVEGRGVSSRIELTGPH